MLYNHEYYSALLLPRVLFTVRLTTCQEKWAQQLHTHLHSHLHTWTELGWVLVIQCFCSAPLTQDWFSTSGTIEGFTPDTHTDIYKCIQHTNSPSEVKQCRHIEKAAYAVLNGLLSKPLHRCGCFAYFCFCSPALVVSLISAPLIQPLRHSTGVSLCFTVLSFYSKVSSNDKPQHSTHNNPVIIINTRQWRCIIYTTLTYLPPVGNRSQITQSVCESGEELFVHMTYVSFHMLFQRIWNINITIIITVRSFFFQWL